VRSHLSCTSRHVLYYLLFCSDLVPYGLTMACRCYARCCTMASAYSAPLCSVSCVQLSTRYSMTGYTQSGKFYKRFILMDGLQRVSGWFPVKGIATCANTLRVLVAIDKAFGAILCNAATVGRAVCSKNYEKGNPGQRSMLIPIVWFVKSQWCGSAVALEPYWKCRCKRPTESYKSHRIAVKSWWIPRKALIMVRPMTKSNV